MAIRTVVYVCRNGHELGFGHDFNKKGKTNSASPSVCLTCLTPFVYADLEKYKGGRV